MQFKPGDRIKTVHANDPRKKNRLGTVRRGPFLEMMIDGFYKVAFDDGATETWHGDRLVAAVEIKDVFLVERQGEAREVFGPYTIATARVIRGWKYQMIRGRGIADGKPIDSADLAKRIAEGSVWTLEEEAAAQPCHSSQ